MKNTLFFLIFYFSFFSLQVLAIENLIQSKEDIKFHKPEEVKFSSLSKIAEFRGVIVRKNPTASDLKAIDLYQFNSKVFKVNKKLCVELLEKMFGISKSKLFGIKSFKMVESNKGDICQYYISDKVELKKNEEPYHRLIFIGFINTKAHALVFHPESVNDAKTTEALQVWNNLR